MNIKIIGIILVSLIVGFVGGYFFVIFHTPSLSSPKTISQPFLAKRIYIENRNAFFLNFQPLRKDINKYIAQNRESKIEYFFEYLPSGMSIGVSERSQVPSGSLVKIPVVLAIYKKIEEGKIKESDILILREKDKDNEFGDFWKKPIGTQITVVEAVRLTLTNSDNTAYKMLYSLLNTQEIEEAFNVTDISFIEVDGELKPYVSAKSYASVFKALFLSVYLNENDSNKLLSFMSESKFNSGLSKYIDKDVQVAHKIGIANFLDKPSNSDCGIVYVPKRPYLICIMAHDDPKIGQEHIAKLSKMTYEYVKTIK